MHDAVHGRAGQRRRLHDVRQAHAGFAARGENSQDRQRTPDRLRARTWPVFPGQSG
jgi:hypothetical protein